MPKTLAEFAAPTSTSQCKTCQAPPEALEQIALNEYSGRPISATSIADWLSAEYGIEVTESSVKRHCQRHLPIEGTNDFPR